MFSSISFGPHNSPNLLASIARVEVVEYVADGGKLAVPAHTVHTVIDGNVPNIPLGKEALGIAAYFQIVTTHAGHILDNDGSDLSRLGQPDHLIPARTVKRYPGHTIVSEKRGIEETVVSCVLQKDFLLERNLSRVFSLLEHSICHAANNCLIFSLG